MKKKNSTTSSEPLVWVIADDKAGHRNQALGVAQALGYPFVTKHLHYTTLGRIPNVLKTGLTGIDTSRSDVIIDPWPDIILSAGRRTIPVARHIKQKSGGSSFWTHIMWPPGKKTDIDLIAVPQHDNMDHKNAISIVGAPHCISADFLEDHMTEWEGAFDEISGPVITLLIGGNAGRKKFTTTHAKNLAIMASTLTDHIKATLLISTSRRTPVEVIEAVQKELKCRHILYNPNTDMHDENPYFAFLHLSDSIIVTGDSISMCSEAASLGKPTFIYAPTDMVPAKHQRMHDTLYKHNYAESFTLKRLGTIEHSLKNPHSSTHIPRLNSAVTIADAIKERFSMPQDTSS